MKWWGLVLLPLIACGTPRVINWEPYSMRMNTKQIAKRAIQIGAGDVGPVRTAGGLPAGTLTMKGHAATIEDAAAVEAAEYGGTHFMMGRWGDSETTHGYHVSESGFGGWNVIPIRSSSRQMEFVVIRVPMSGWHDLPTELTPEPVEEEKN